MASLNPIVPPLPTERRAFERRRIEGLVDVDFGPDNAGILFDLSEDGVGFQSFFPLSVDQVLLLKFSAPGASDQIETFAKVVWLNESGKGGGLKFLEISAAARDQIHTWMEALPRSVTAIRTMVAEPPVESQSATEQAAVESNAPLGNNPSLGMMAAKAPAPRVSTESAGGRVRFDLLSAASPKPANVVAPRVAVPEPATIAASPIRRVPAAPAPPNTNRIHTAPQKQAEVPAVAPREAPMVRRGSVPAPAMSESEESVSPTPAYDELTFGGDSAPAGGAWRHVLKIGVAAIAGGALALVVAALVPAMRAHLQSTASTSSDPTAQATTTPVFQVEVVDLNNRRWILKSGDEAGSPFPDLSRRATHTAPVSPQPEKSAPRSDEDADSSAAPPPVGDLRPAQRGALALARPVANRSGSAEAQAQTQTSIFDGITPPIGSLSDTLPVIGPAMPGPVAPHPEGSQAAPEPIQAAVLLQRVAPVYPNVTVAGQTGGEVQVSAVIDKNGVPTNLKIAGGDPRFAEAAMTAMREWRYRPATLGGKPIQSATTVNFVFDSK